jgi:hypothetical protein
MVKKSSLQSGIYNAGGHLDIKDSIRYSEENPLTLNNTTKKILYKGKLIMDEPHNIFHRYKAILMDHTTYISIDKRMMGRPDAISEKYYGTPDLWFLVMWANNAFKPEDLMKSAVKVIEYNQVEKIIEIALTYQSDIRDNEQNIPEKKNTTLVNID